MRVTELMEQAIKDGCKTISDYAAWYYQQGRVDVLQEIVDKQETEEEEPFPLFAEESIRIQKKKEKQERFGDYSDQGEEHD